MKRFPVVQVLILTVMLALNLAVVSAQDSPQITSFSTSVTSIGRQALENRTARIPVSWTTVSRPLTANLVFEQIFSDGSKVNVELPRVISWVASSGDGIAAAISPGDAVNHIVLRVTLFNIFTDQVYDIEEITIPIVSGSGGSGQGRVPAITSFVINYASTVNRDQLTNQSVRLPVSWEAINRPITANLVFEQVLEDGSVVNVELPRPFAWVNSADSGVVAPVDPGGGATQLVFRVRLIDLIYNRILDQRYAYYPITAQSAAPRITRFTSTTRSISFDVLSNPQTRIDVSWSVENRPPNTNLVFEQILPDGRVRNVELPRDVPIVPSSGDGVVRPVLPTQDIGEVVLQIRLIDLGNNGTLASATLRIPVINNGDNRIVVVTGDACYRDPFPASQGLSVGDEGRVQTSYNAGLAVYSALEDYQSVATLDVGDVFRIEQGPYCTYLNGEGRYSRRRWFISTGQVEGWADEYRGDNISGFVYNFIPADQDDIPQAEIVSFTITPDNVDADALDETMVTFRWESNNGTRAHIAGAQAQVYYDLAPSGSFTVRASELDLRSNPVEYTLEVFDRQNNSVTQTVTFMINSAVAINSFSVSPQSARGNTQVIISWDIRGDFSEAYIWWAPNVAQPLLTRITDITSNVGSYNFTLPDDVAGDRQLTLQVQDESGAYQSAVIILHIDCAYDWELGISDETCPRSPLISRVGAYQTFQRGFMVWLPADDSSMWVFYNDGTVTRYNDNWDGSDFTIDGDVPDGLFAPERGFGYLWNTTPVVRSGLGWATAPEQGYTVTAQATLYQQGWAECWYITLPDGRLIRASRGPEALNMYWEVVR